MVGCPIGKCFAMSQTHTGSRLAASKFKIRMRVGSASALNHPAYSRARPCPSFGEVAVRQHTPLLPADLFLRANGRASPCKQNNNNLFIEERQYMPPTSR